MIDGGVEMRCYVDFVELIRDRHHFLDLRGVWPILYVFPALSILACTLL